MATVTKKKTNKPTGKKKSSKPVGRDAIRSAAKSAKANAGKPRGKAVASAPVKDAYGSWPPEKEPDVADADAPSTLPNNDNVDSGGLDEAALNDAIGKSAQDGAIAAENKKRRRKGDSVSIGGTDDDPNQTYLDGIEPDRDSALEEIMGDIIECEDKIDLLETTRGTRCTELTKLMLEKNRETYRYQGKIARLKHGVDMAKIYKAPKNA